MKWRPKPTPATGAGEALALGTREGKASDKIVSHPEDQVKYHTRYQIGYLNGKAVYAPLHAPSRGLAIEEDWSYLRAMTPEEVLAFATQLNRDMTTYLLIAEEEHKSHLLAEEWYSEIGHGMAYHGPHTPRVV